ncbi:nucleoside hydrolase [Rathayibacter tritici]|uniref:Nucleoside hydrolase n=1 Tax=Rathayibacter tritici TaxID=33888 RepID=A0A160KUB6_9MICO|nr:nucleoside hydrolase [Rathayibacter tritici]AND17480.1 nucleoside hydrolase [Rathayibacter tritici]PPI50232.1 hypothetical protein C5D18_00650 [Rathayibacter tritici]
MDSPTAALVPGNVTAVAEATAWHDLTAATEVVAADGDLTLVPLDSTRRHLMPEEHRPVLLSSSDPLARAVGQALDYCFDCHVGGFPARPASPSPPSSGHRDLDQHAPANHPAPPDREPKPSTERKTSPSLVGGAWWGRRA